jgi:hypothetical protein
VQSEITMADNDDFEIINESGLSNEHAFEFIDVNDVTEKNTKTNKPTTPDVVLPLLVPKPLVNEIPQVVQQQTPSPIINPPQLEDPNSPIKTKTLITPFVQIKKTIPPPPSPPRIISPVPPLPKAPAPKRYGDAALIPHNLDGSLDVNTVIDKSRKNQRNTLTVSTQQQQQQDIQIVLEQRRNLQNKK